jgi:hypothetical protein
MTNDNKTALRELLEKMGEWRDKQLKGVVCPFSENSLLFIINSGNNAYESDDRVKIQNELERLKAIINQRNNNR